MEQIAAASGITKLIVYRHFASKEALYRAVLQQVFDRLAEEFLTGYTRRPEGGGVGARSMLRVARENPAGFELLWRHAAREPQFAEYASELRDHAVDASRARCSSSASTRRLHEWAAQTVVGYLVEATLNWLEFGDPERDDEFIDLATAAGAGRDRHLGPLTPVRRRRGTRLRRAARSSSRPAATRSPPRAGRGSARGWSSAAA